MGEVKVVQLRDILMAEAEAVALGPVYQDARLLVLPVSEAADEAVTSAIRETKAQVGLADVLSKEETEKSIREDFTKWMRVQRAIENARLVSLVWTEEGKPLLASVEEAARLPKNVRKALLAAIERQVEKGLLPESQPGG